MIGYITKKQQLQQKQQKKTLVSAQPIMPQGLDTSTIANRFSFQFLPEHCLFNCLSYLECENDVVRCSVVSRDFHMVATSNAIWKRLYLVRFGAQALDLNMRRHLCPILFGSDPTSLTDERVEQRFQELKAQEKITCRRQLTDVELHDVIATDFWLGIFRETLLSRVEYGLVDDRHHIEYLIRFHAWQLTCADVCKMVLDRVGGHFYKIALGRTGYTKRYFLTNGIKGVPYIDISRDERLFASVVPEFAMMETMTLL